MTALVILLSYISQGSFLDLMLFNLFYKWRRDTFFFHEYQLGDLQTEHTSRRASVCTREELGRCAQKVMPSYNQLFGLIPSKIFSSQADRYPSSDMKAGSLAARKEEGWVSQIEWEYLKWDGWDSLRKDQTFRASKKQAALPQRTINKQANKVHETQALHGGLGKKIPTL